MPPGSPSVLAAGAVLCLFVLARGGRLPPLLSGAEAAFGGARIRGRVLVGLFAGFLGIVVLIWPSLFAADVSGPRFGLGVLLVQVVCLGWAVGSSMSRRTQSTAGTAAASALQQLFAGVLLTSVGTALGAWSQLAFTPKTIAAELYLIVFEVRGIRDQRSMR